MDYIRHIPAPPLDAYIDDLYYIGGFPSFSRLIVPPVPSLHLMVNFGQPFQMYARSQVKPFVTCSESWWIGMWSQYWIVDWPTPVQFYGVHFKPAGVYPFLRLPLSELHNQIIPGEAIWGQFAAEIRDRLYSAPTAQAGLTLLERLLLSRLCEAPHGLDVVQYSMRRMDWYHGALSIRALSDHMGISQNHLGTQFKRMVGVPAKDLARFYRFIHIVCSLDPAQPVDWTQVARRSHFYDVSHLNKDFQEFTGHSPTDDLRLRRRFDSENPEHGLDVGPLPID